MTLGNSYSSHDVCRLSYRNRVLVNRAISLWCVEGQSAKCLYTLGEPFRAWRHAKIDTAEDTIPEWLFVCSCGNRDLVRQFCCRSGPLRFDTAGDACIYAIHNSGNRPVAIWDTAILP